MYRLFEAIEDYWVEIPEVTSFEGVGFFNKDLLFLAINDRMRVVQRAVSLNNLVVITCLD